MSTRRPLKLAFDRRLRALGTGLSAPLDRDPEALHRARVASRRLRAALPLLGGDAGLSDGERRGLRLARREIRRLTVALGRVREMDVALDIVSGLGTRRPDLAAGTDAIRAAIERERASHLGTLRERVSVARLRRVSRWLAEAARRADEGRAADSGATDLRTLGDHLAARIEHAGVLYAVDRLHAVRVAAKKLRYTLELEHEVRGRSTEKWVLAVRRVQAVLGRLHDLEVVAGYAAVIGGADVGEEVRTAVQSVRDILEQEIHEQHAAYLGSRDVLLRVAHAAGRAR